MFGTKEFNAMKFGNGCILHGTFTLATVIRPMLHQGYQSQQGVEPLSHIQLQYCTKAFSLSKVLSPCPCLSFTRQFKFNMNTGNMS